MQFLTQDIQPKIQLSGMRIGFVAFLDYLCVLSSVHMEGKFAV
jgi:hypothetical protein